MKLILISELMQDEIYLEEESKNYDSFDEVILFTLKTPNYKNDRLDNENIKKGEIDISYKNIFDRMYYLFRGLFSKKGIEELSYLFKSKKFSKESLKKYLLFTAKSELLTSTLEKKFSKMNIKEDENLVFYSYRLGVGVTAGLNLKKTYKNSKIISRCHGQDLFAFRNKDNYLPYRKLIYTNIDRLYCISNDGMKYIENEYKEYNVDTKLAYLGTNEIGYNENISNKPFVIVTTSRISPIKRLHLLAEALKEIKDYNIKWVHFGDGELSKQYYENIKNICAEFPKNIDVEFKGFVNSESLANYYKSEMISLFINVSESEGLPVSIMEACAAGLPILATDVGGTKEIVEDGINGVLLNKDFTKRELISKILEFYNMDSIAFKKMSANSNKIWKEKFSSKRNYQEFVKDIKNMNFDN